MTSSPPPAGSEYYPTVGAFVAAHGGTAVVEKVLLANNGISAVKAIRSIRRWAYDMFGRERAIKFVAMATPEDLRANAEYIRMADEFVEVPGGSNHNNYANVSLIVELAKRYQVNAVFAGWGHASENPALPTSLEREGIVFMGPPAGPMFALGDKIGSTIIAQSAGVPVIPWSGDALRCDYAKSGGVIPEEIYSAANVRTVEECKAAVERVGLPVMIKASEGGGGKGIRKVLTSDQIETAFRQVQSEVPGSPIFVMRVAFGARHLEVQLLADHHGNAIALNGRDCSIQRRHQKILEEGPPVSAPPDVWRNMEKAAVRLAKEVGYRNAGTVEYLFREDDKSFFFLELNPRLQVEHPVTEMITNVNLPAAQLQVAMGIPLYRIRDIRVFYGRDPNGTDVIDFDNSEAIPADGHCIAARITAENPYKGFQPTSGKITELNFRSSRHVWGYFSIDSSGLIHEFADSQLGHVFAWGKTREIARRNLVIALKEMSIRGEIRTTIEYLKDLLEVPDYKNNNFHTAWLDDRIAKSDIAVQHLSALDVVMVGAAVETHTRSLGREKTYMHALERGQLPSLALLDPKHSFELIYENVKYSFETVKSGASLYSLQLKGNASTVVVVEVRSLADEGFLVLLGGVSHVAYTKSEVGAKRLVVDSQTCLFVEEYDPTVIRASMGGKIVRFLKKDGEDVKKDEPFCEIEVMKMNMPLCAPEDGRIHPAKTAGAVMLPGDLVAKLDLHDPSKVRRAELFKGSLPALGEPWPEVLGSNSHHILAHALERLDAVMIGFAPPTAVKASAFSSLAGSMYNPYLCGLEIRELMARVKRELSAGLVDKVLETIQATETELDALTKESKTAATFEKSAALANELLRLFNESGAPVNPGLLAICERHAPGPHGFVMSVLEGLLEKYAAPEALFAELELSDSAEKDDVMQELRRQFADEPKKVYDLALSHANVHAKNALAVDLLTLVEGAVRRQEELLDKSGPSVRARAVNLLKRIAALRGKDTTEVALEARQLLIELQSASYAERLESVVSRLAKMSKGEAEAREEIQSSTDPVLHYLIDVVAEREGHSFSEEIRAAALEAYIMRVYQTYTTKNVAVHKTPVGLVASWSFYSEPDAIPFGGASVSPAAPAQPIELEDSPPPNHVRTPSLSSHGTDTKQSSVPPPFMRQQSAMNRARAGSGWDDSATINTSKEEPLVDAGELMAHAVPPFVLRKGALAKFDGLEELMKGVPELLKVVASSPKDLEAIKDDQVTSLPDVAVLHIMLNRTSLVAEAETSDKTATKLANFLRSVRNELSAGGVRRVTFAVPQSDGKHSVVSGHGSSFFTFRRRTDWAEDVLVRHIEPALAFQLDLARLSNFNIARVPLGKRDLSSSRTVHVYRATPKGAADPRQGSRLFVRALVRQTSKVDGVSLQDAFPGPERVLVQAIEAIQSSNIESGARNHIFLNVLGDATVEPQVVERMAYHLGRRYAARLATARVGQVELKVNARLDKDSPSIPVRVVASNPTGFGLRVDVYVEAANPTDGRLIFYSISQGNDGGAAGALAAMGLSDPPASSNQSGYYDDLLLEDSASHPESSPEWHGLDTRSPYPVSSPMEERRSRSLASGTAFAYDLPAIFHKALEKSWREYANQGRRGVDMPSPSTLCVFEELVLADELDAPALEGSDGKLVRTTRGPGLNTISMVAWRAVLKTPQYPDGRELILISNDITVDAGSFGTREDDLFLEASKFARKKGIPRLYVAANSGARIGMADEVKRAFRVAWIDPTDPTKGFEYLYLDAEKHAQLGPQGRSSVICSPIDVILPDGKSETRFRIDAIVGEGRDLGVENLRGSGFIAGETSRAYDEIFTLTYVAGRSVGIGAYLVRLGQRTIQKGKDAPIILTGYQALNTLCGAPVYSSNLSLGGPGIMFANGVTHQCVRNDLEGVFAMLNWLSYVPASKESTLPLTRLLRDDACERDIGYAAPSPAMASTTDPRFLLTGVEGPKDEWISGLFDRGSFTEYLGGWAKTMVTGRARLGGIPVGVIIPETRSVVTRIPADPAQPDSQERVVTQAGSVWYPDSSHKTATAIRDINREGLPLVFLINLRGFSGGLRDMHEAVLKQGAAIVDALVDFKQPCIVYILPGAELRGGAWVVVDPSINENVMEMWCETSSRGGVLEAAGAASIKFRERDQIAVMHRIDDTMKALDAKLVALKSTGTPEEIKKVADAIRAREKLLAPVYLQAAIEFADCHDRPGRMVATGVVKGVVEWKSARKFFTNRLKRLLKEFALARKIQQTSQKTLLEARAALKSLYEESGAVLSQGAWDVNDAAALAWMDSHDGLAAVDAHVRAVAEASIQEEVERLGNVDPNAMLRGLMALIGRMGSEGRHAEREKLVSTLRRGVFLLSTSHSSSNLLGSAAPATNGNGHR